LDNIPKDEDMEGQTTWEESNLAPLEVMEEWAIVAPKVGRNEGEHEPSAREGRLDARQHIEGATFFNHQDGSRR
jgi:hypothetical protein